MQTELIDTGALERVARGAPVRRARSALDRRARQADRCDARRGRGRAAADRRRLRRARDRPARDRRRLPLRELARRARGRRSVPAAAQDQPVAAPRSKRSPSSRISQPVTKAEIEAVRGVNVDCVVATLLDRRFIAEAGRRETSPAGPMHYKTTPEFLEAFGCARSTELPPVDLGAPNRARVAAADPPTDAGRRASAQSRKYRYHPVRSSYRPSPARRPIWARIDANCQAVAHAHELIQPGETFTPHRRPAQRRSTTISAELDAGEFEFLLKAPTGSGKTEVMLRVAVDEVLRSGGYACRRRADARSRPPGLSPTSATGSRARGSASGRCTAAISPGERRDARRGSSADASASSWAARCMISIDPLWDVLDRSALTIVDDVNAFDEREHLRLLEDLDCPLLFASATPNELRALPRPRRRVQQRRQRCGRCRSTCCRRRSTKSTGVWGEPAGRATGARRRADPRPPANASRASSSSAARAATCRSWPQRLEETYGIAVQQLRGDMADTCRASQAQPAQRRAASTARRRASR